jgi:hypothetical protein
MTQMAHYYSPEEQPKKVHACELPLFTKHIQEVAHLRPKPFKSAPNLHEIRKEILDFLKSWGKPNPLA